MLRVRHTGITPMRYLTTAALLLASALSAPAHAQGHGGLFQGAQDAFQGTVATLGQALGRAPAGGCGRRAAEYRVDWLAYAAQDRGPSGVPNRAGSVGVDGGYGPDWSIAYGGLTRRFTFDRPETVATPGLPLGGLEIGMDLMAYGEITEVHLQAPLPVERLTLVFEGLGTSYGATSSVTDGVWVEGIAPDGRRVAPAYLYPTLEAGLSDRLVRQRADQEGFGAPWAWGTQANTQGNTDPLPLTTTFHEPVQAVVLRFTGGPADQAGWAAGVDASPNPQPQSILLSSMAFCLR